MAHTLPPLPYASNAMEPHIDTQTMEIHHTKHHQAYINNLNKAVEGTPLESKSAEELIKDLSVVPEDKRMVVRNNAGGHVNHSFFWQVIGWNAGGKPGQPAKTIVGAGRFDFELRRVCAKKPCGSVACRRYGWGA